MRALNRVNAHLRWETEAFSRELDNRDQNDSIFGGSEFEGFSTERSGLQAEAGTGILSFGVPAFVVDEFLSCLLAGLATDGGEKGLEAVVVVLAPLFVGMVMALRALHANSKENLRDILHLFLTLPHRTVY